MTRPRCLEPRQTYLVTRRCSERRFFLRPDAALNNLLLYLLAIAAKRYEIELHAFAFMSNHYHLVLSETSAEVRLPEFMGWFNQHIAKLVNILRGRRENLWAPGSYNAVVLVGEEAVWDKLVYTICNPVAAGLVEKPADWGVGISLPWMVESKTFKPEDPGLYFKTKPAEQPALTLARPPCFKGKIGLRRFRKLLSAKVKDRLSEIYDRRERDGAGPFLGMDEVMAQNPVEKPKTEEPVQTRNPRVACKDAKRRAKILEAIKRFEEAHAEALEAWQNGKHEVLFPAGTYAMRRHFGACCREGAGIYSLT